MVTKPTHKPSCIQMHIMVVVVAVVVVVVVIVVVVVVAVVITLLLERSTHQCFCSSALLKYFAPRRNTGPILTRRYDMCPTAETAGNTMY